MPAQLPPCPVAPGTWGRAGTGTVLQGCGGLSRAPACTAPVVQGGCLQLGGGRILLGGCVWLGPAWCCALSCPAAGLSERCRALPSLCLVCFPCSFRALADSRGWKIPARSGSSCTQVPAVVLIPQLSLPLPRVALEAQPELVKALGAVGWGSRLCPSSARGLCSSPAAPSPQRPRPFGARLSCGDPAGRSLEQLLDGAAPGRPEGAGAHAEGREAALTQRAWGQQNKSPLGINLPAGPEEALAERAARLS